MQLGTSSTLKGTWVMLSKVQIGWFSAVGAYSGHRERRFQPKVNIHSKAS